MGFRRGVLEDWLASAYSDGVHEAVLAWVFAFRDGPPADAGLVFGNPRHPYYSDPEYWSARLNTSEGLIELRFVLMTQRDGPDTMAVQYLGPPPPVSPSSPRR